jgi:hypothetical protein
MSYRLCVLATLFAINACEGTDIIQHGKTAEPLNEESGAFAERDECIASCVEAHPEGFSSFILIGYNCACTKCDEVCADEVCQSNAPAQGECVDCVNESISSSCADDSAFQTNCVEGTPCGDYVACFAGCAPPAVTLSLDE